MLFIFCACNILVRFPESTGNTEMVNRDARECSASHEEAGESAEGPDSETRSMRVLLILAEFVKKNKGASAEAE